MNNFTHEDFIRHFSNQTDSEDNIAIKSLILDEADFNKIFQEITLPFSILMEIKSGVSDRTLSKIILHAKNVHSKIHLN